MGNYLRLRENFVELERIQYRSLYVSPEKLFGSYCNYKYIKESLLRKYSCELQMSSPKA
jgi:hypothetical protein